MNNKIHTPEGVRDLFGRVCDKKRYLDRTIEKLFRSFGYQSIETPTLEFFEVFSGEIGTTPSRDLYKLIDREGDTLVLRPDFTPSIARAFSMYFEQESMPVRLCYSGSVFANNLRLQGRLKESTQMGVELLNEPSAEADAELIALVVFAMRRVGLVNFQVTIGHVDYLAALTDEAELSDEASRELREMLAEQNRFGAQDLVQRLGLRKDLRDAFLAVPELYGDAVVLERAKKLTSNERALCAVARLQKIREQLRAYGCEDSVTFDLGMVTEHSYYSGIVFQAYTYGSGDALIKGGRYDNLLERFGKSAPAIGFAVQLDQLLAAIDRQGVQLPVYDRKTMVLYPAQLQETAVRFAAAQREQGLDVACVRFEAGHVLDDYRAYGQREQFGGIIYFRSSDEVYAIDLTDGNVQTVDMRPYLGDGLQEGGENA